MTAYLLDTNIISETSRQAPAPQVLSWLRETDEPDILTSAVTLAEIHYGIQALHTAGKIEKAESLADWAERIEQSFSVLPFDAAAARIWGEYRNQTPAALAWDAMIAAVAAANELVVATRNQRDFDRFGVTVFNPWQR